MLCLGKNLIHGVQSVSYKSKNTKDSNAIKAKKKWDADPDCWSTLWFHKLMTIDEARGRARQLNAQEFVKRQEERIQLKNTTERWFFIF